jgi:hypothetical protein
VCTHYSCFENISQFATLKKNWVQSGTKSRVQKTGSLLSPIFLRIQIQLMRLLVGLLVGQLLPSFFIL